MPRKHKTEASVSENREAQRRSRARRKDLIADLQGRLSNYERAGIAASVEMQRVARKVNEQNRRLKWLLSKHGVVGEEVERVLALPEADFAQLLSSTSVEKLPQVQDHDGPLSSIAQSSNVQPALESPCDEAAEILVQLHHADPVWARSALGCKGEERSCFVKNTRIFQLMEEGYVFRQESHEGEEGGKPIRRRV